MDSSQLPATGLNPQLDTEPDVVRDPANLQNVHGHIAIEVFLPTGGNRRCDPRTRDTPQVSVPAFSDVAQSLLEHVRERMELRGVAALDPGRALLKRDAKPGTSTLINDRGKNLVITLLRRQRFVAAVVRAHDQTRGATLAAVGCPVSDEILHVAPHCACRRGRVMERHASRDRRAAPLIDELGQVEQSHHTPPYQIVRDRAVPLRFKLLRTHRRDGQHGKHEEQCAHCGYQPRSPHCRPAVNSARTIMGRLQRVSPEPSMQSRK